MHSYYQLMKQWKILSCFVSSGSLQLCAIDASWDSLLMEPFLVDPAIYAFFFKLSQFIFSTCSNSRKNSSFGIHTTQNQVLKKVVTAIHFLSLLGIFISVIIAPYKSQYVIITAAVTFMISFIIPPRGMLKPDEAAPDWLEKNQAPSGGKGKKEWAVLLAALQ